MTFSLHRAHTKKKIKEKIWKEERRKGEREMDGWRSETTAKKSPERLRLGEENFMADETDTEEKLQQMKQ